MITTIMRVLRGFAILIALAGVFDPAVTSTRRAKPVIAVVSGDSITHRALVQRVASELARDFTVLHAPFGGAAATVVVGDQFPAAVGESTSPAFVVSADRTAENVALEYVHAPAHAPFQARVPVTAGARVMGARGGAVEFSLVVGGIVVDRVTRGVAKDDELVGASLAFVPAAAGAAPLRVTVKIAGTSRTVAADAVVDVRTTRWTVLFFDRRPSYMSTFVRRAIERDVRFAVTSRVITSRNVSTDAGRPPESLDDLGSLAPFDAIVVGAPESLTERDVAGLDAYLRRRGGSAILLFDQQAAGPYERLTEVGQWSHATTSAAAPVVPAARDSAALRAAELAWPARLPAGAKLVASSSNHPVIWQSAVGAGRLVVSGALDSWRYRDVATPGFDEFWRSEIADAADAAAPAIDVTVAKPLLTPGEATDLTVTLRDAALAASAIGSSVHGTVAASLDGPGPPVHMKLWPEGPIGHFRGILRAPQEAGSYRVAVSSGVFNAGAPVEVAPDRADATPDDRALLREFAESRGGAVFAASGLNALSATLSRTLQPQSRRETWHPMRSPWWIIPFALFLSAEWYARRRRRLA